jgi:hypothetical protein
MYCDACIQERLGLKWRQQVQLITLTLSCTERFVREQAPCCTCHESKQVITAVKNDIAQRSTEGPFAALMFGHEPLSRPTISSLRVTSNSLSSRQPVGAGHRLKDEH